MDRTIIVPYRVEEKELSHILYNAIHGLTLLHTPTEDLKKCLSEEMFIKPNQQAFFQVMFYLFRILDAQEFRKRFFWPITDKKSESNFRTSTVEYLKHLNEKHQLHWNHIKSYLVVMPGGMKFISFLLDFVGFIAQELIKQKEKQLNLETGHQQRDQVSLANLQKTCGQNAFFKEMASEFLENIECVNNKYDEKYQLLMHQLEKLSCETGLNVDMLIDDKFLEDFDQSSGQLFDKQYTERTQKILAMEQLIGELKEAMDKFHTKETGYKYDKQRICLQLRRIRDHFPMEELIEESFASKVTDDGVNIDALIKTFNCINETIQNELKVANKRPCAGEFVYSRLLSLKQNLQEIETQITDFKKMLHINMKKQKQPDFPHTPVRDAIAAPNRRCLQNTLLMKLVSTPPIKFEVPEGGGKSRLALVDSKTNNANETTFNNFLAPPRTVRQTNRHNSIAEQSMTDLNNSGMNRSKIIDPMQLLRSTSKKDSSRYKATAPQLNISNLGSKWKQQQSLFNDNEDEMPAVTTSSLTTTAKCDDSLSSLASPKLHLKQTNISKTATTPQSFTKTATPTMIHQSPFTPFNSNDRTRIARSQYQLFDTSSAERNNLSPIAASLSYIKKVSAVRKVQDASLNFANLSTSPSGRLEPLVTAEELNIPKLKLNDLSLIEHDVSLNNSMAFEKPKIVLNSSHNEDLLLENDENNANAANINKSLLNESCDKFEEEKDQQLEDVLFDTSDSVLKDVTL